ncbi:MAG: hypothetical protein CL609_22060 [Anaerolineaceae bacterium]|nr:hypothetical protein [Anaerolineaceae bacterium]
MIHHISNQIYQFVDTCNVYVLKNGKQAVLVDFGSGDVLAHLATIGVTEVTAILLTHHHRDQAQGLKIANARHIPVWVPHTEQDLFKEVDQHWLSRELQNNYNVRQDRFSILHSISIMGTLKDYQKIELSGLSLQILPTPGHTTGSITIILNQDQKKFAFCGDLIYAPGKLWSLAATQWTYNGAEGIPATIVSLLDLKERDVIALLPSHGEVMKDVPSAVDILVEKLWNLLRLRGQNPRLFQLREKPYEAILPHLLKHRASMANTYVLLSDSGKALMIDFGYDFITGISAGSDRASRRPWLYTLPALKKQFGVTKVDVVLPTHYHDDHVAGLNLLRTVEGTQTWVPENFADILENPRSYDLPCLWYDPIPVDNKVALNTVFVWEEYSLILYALPGHTRYAVAVSVTVDGKRVLAVGDQYQNDDGLLWNYVYQNRYQIGDYVKTAALYQRLQPELILPGHWQPFEVTPEYLMAIMEQAVEMENLQTSLLPEEVDLGSEGFIARIQPYQTIVRIDSPLTFTVEIQNPYPQAEVLTVNLVVPEGWEANPMKQQLKIEKSLVLTFQVQPPLGLKVWRERIAVDVSFGNHRFGQQAEAFISIKGREIL